MKTVLKFFVATFITLGFVACDPCANMICDNGSCDKGTCNCNAGYYLNNKNCIGVNKKYVGIGTASATQTGVDNQGNTTTPTNPEITLLASTTDPYKFTLLRFNNVIKNDIVFTVKTDDYQKLETQNNITTIAGSSYNISGSKTGSVVTLVIAEPNGTTYTLKYGA